LYFSFGNPNVSLSCFRELFRIQILVEQQAITHTIDEVVELQVQEAFYPYQHFQFFDFAHQELRKFCLIMLFNVLKALCFHDQLSCEKMCTHHCNFQFGPSFLDHDSSFFHSFTS
jgi:hypothetical protein